MPAWEWPELLATGFEERFEQWFTQRKKSTMKRSPKKGVNSRLKDSGLGNEGGNQW
jgi:hypothetical protein